MRHNRRMAAKPEPSTNRKPARNTQRMRIGAAAGLGALVTVFAVLNIDEVDVNWVFGTVSTPLIVVILLCIAAGMAIDRALVHRGRSRKRKRGAGDQGVGSRL